MVPPLQDAPLKKKKAKWKMYVFFFSVNRKNSFSRVGDQIVAATTVLES